MLRLRGQSKRDLGERVEMPSLIDDGSDLAWRAGTVERRLHWLQLTNPAPRLPRAESGSGSALRDDEDDLLHTPRGKVQTGESEDDLDLIKHQHNICPTSDSGAALTCRMTS